MLRCTIRSEVNNYFCVLYRGQKYVWVRSMGIFEWSIEETADRSKNMLVSSAVINNERAFTRNTRVSTCSSLDKHHVNMSMSGRPVRVWARGRRGKHEHARREIAQHCFPTRSRAAFTLYLPTAEVWANQKTFKIQNELSNERSKYATLSM